MGGSSCLWAMITSLSPCLKLRIAQLIQWEWNGSIRIGDFLLRSRLTAQRVRHRTHLTPGQARGKQSGCSSVG